MRDLTIPPLLLLAAATLLLARPAPALAQTATAVPEIEVTSTRRPGPLFDSPRAVAVVGEREIEERQSRTAPEALRETPGIMVQQTAYGQGSPVIRGFTGNQVLILVDGVRLNNSTFRFGANQYLATVDPFTIGRIDVVRGPASVLYGSDALGGVIHVRTREREDLASAYDLGGALIGRYGSAGKELTGRVSLEGNLGDLGALGGFTYSDFDDLRGGRNTGVQPNTHYRVESGDVKVSYDFDGRHELTAAYQHLAQHNVPRSDRMNLALPGRLPPSLLLMFEPQQRDLTYVAYRFEDPSLALAGIRSNVSWQRQEEGRLEITTAAPNRLTRDRDWVETWGTSHQVETAEVARQVFTTGLEYYRDHVYSRRTVENLTTGAISPVRPRFADGGHYHTFGAFLQDEVRIVPERLKLVLGGRYTHIEVDGSFTDPRTGAVSLDQSIDSVTGSLSLWASPVDEVAFVGSVAQGFRAPNFDDLSVFGQVGQGFEIPNPDAEPERTLSFEAGVKWRLPGREPLLTGALFGHWTEIDDLLQRAPGELNGLPFIDANGNGVQDAGEQAVVQRRNVGRAQIFGIEAELRLRAPDRISLAGERWSIFGHFFWTYGMNLEDDEPVRGIPPATGLAGVRTEWGRGGRFWFEAVGQFVRDQDRLAAADALDARIPPGGTPGYEMYTLRGGAHFRLFRAPGLRAPPEGGAGFAEKDYDAAVALAVENILDRDYRVHGSGINGAGTNFVVTLELRF